MEKEDRLQKQEYLKTEIIDAQYDPSSFEEFICTLKEDGNNNEIIFLILFQEAILIIELLQNSFKLNYKLFIFEMFPLDCLSI